MLKKPAPDEVILGFDCDQETAAWAIMRAGDTLLAHGQHAQRDGGYTTWCREQLAQIRAQWAPRFCSILNHVLPPNSPQLAIVESAAAAGAAGPILNNATTNAALIERWAVFAELEGMTVQSVPASAWFYLYHDGAPVTMKQILDLKRRLVMIPRSLTGPSMSPAETNAAVIARILHVLHQEKDPGQFLRTQRTAWEDRMKDPAPRPALVTNPEAPTGAKVIQLRRSTKKEPKP